MSICTFFGHRDAPKKTEPALRVALLDLIENKNVDLFYVGNHGGFDRMVRKCLTELKTKYPHIKYYVVLAYIPLKKENLMLEDGEETLYPAGLERTPPKYAIIKRNYWMIEKSDYVVTYVDHITGGAAHFKEVAEKKGKTVINLDI